jgi:hypothetical protein
MHNYPTNRLVLFTHSHVSCEQVWLSAIGGARPAGARAQANGGTLKLGGKYEFQVWQGTSQVPVVSVFPAQDNQKFTSFSADMKELLSKLPEPLFIYPLSLSFSHIDVFLLLLLC